MIPCLDEAESIEQCVASATTAFADGGLVGEVIVADNGSIDGSQARASNAGARVVHEARRGYGNALRAGFAAARGHYVVMADADLTYDFADIPRFVAGLADGADMVMGNRMKGIEPGAMPWLHRYVGNPMLTFVLNLLFGTRVGDAHCGMRAFRREALDALALRSPGMELASEMVIRAGHEKLRIDEIPILYHQRAGESKLDTLGDGWRHLRFLLVHSPTYLFLVPALAAIAFGVAAALVVLLGVPVLGRTWDLHALATGSLFIVVGAQLLGMGICAHAYGAYFLGRREEWFERLRARWALEHVLLLGILVAVAGLALCAGIFATWVGRDFGALRDESLFVVGTTLVILGAQIVFTSFLVSILGLRAPASASSRRATPVTAGAPVELDPDQAPEPSTTHRTLTGPQHSPAEL
ncbi:MAG: glycosyltransferase family 2 protein [Thermoleophilaceae bacterium]